MMLFNGLLLDFCIAKWC